MSVLPARHSPQTSFYDCSENGHHKEDISNLRTDNSCNASRHFCVQGDLLYEARVMSSLLGDCRLVGSTAVSGLGESI